MTQKHNHAKAILLALLLVLGMIVSPVCALGYEVVLLPMAEVTNVQVISNLTVDLSQDGNALQRLVVDIGTGTKVDFTLWYGNGATVSGWMEYRNSTDCVDWIPFDSFCQYSGVSIGADTQDGSSRGLQEIGRIDIAAYARNWTSDTEYTTGFLVWDTTFGLEEGHKAYFAVPNGTDNIIYKFSVTTTKPVQVGWNYDARERVITATSKNPIDVAKDWLSQAIFISGAVFGFIASLFWILKFFFVDNLLLIIALWISVSMAYSAISTKNIFAFYTKFFRLQRAFLDFVIGLWDVLVRIVGGMVQALLKWL
jgi:hypothetical protein